MAMAMGQVGGQPQGVAAALGRLNGDSVHSSTPAAAASVQSASSSSSMFRGHLLVAAAASKARLVISQHNRSSVAVTCEAATAVSGDTSAPGNLFLFLVKEIVESNFLSHLCFVDCLSPLFILMESSADRLQSLLRKGLGFKSLNLCVHLFSFWY